MGKKKMLGTFTGGYALEKRSVIFMSLQDQYLLDKILTAILENKEGKNDPNLRILHMRFSIPDLIRLPELKRYIAP